MLSDIRVHELFEAQAGRAPDAPAVLFNDTSWSYRFLDGRANQIARGLRAQGVGRGDLVGVLLERSPDLLAALLGIMKTGAAYMPLGNGDPPVRSAAILADCKPRAVLTEASLQERLPPSETRVLRLDEISDEALTRLPVAEGEPEDLAYVIYTSGSTGKPKGVAVSHRSVANFLISMRQAPGLGPGDTLLALTPIVSDISVLELFLPAVSGATLLMAEADLSTASIAGLLSRYKVTALQMTPFYWNLLLEAGWTGQPGLKMLSGCAPLPGELARRLLARGESLWNLYGPTETTVWSTLFHHDGRQGPSPIGGPIANTELYVLNEDMQSVVPGEIGELYIGGMGVAQGYLNAPALTAERFLKNPFSIDPSTRLFKTGDRARRLPDGQLEFLGRLDYRLDVNGFHAEPEEIEAALNEHPRVAESLAFLDVISGGEMRLSALIVVRSPAPDGSELRGFLSERLPAFMIPEVYLKTDRLPRTPAGKIDRKAAR